MVVIKGSKSNRRRFTGGGPRPDLKEMKRREAKERDDAWAKLSPKEQLAALDRRLGKGVGAVKQRARLAVLIDENAKKPQEQKVSREKAKERRSREQAERPQH